MTEELTHSFKIPHDKFHACGDTIVVQVPKPSKTIGRFIVPDSVRDMNQTNVMCGKILKIGPVAFTRKDPDGEIRRESVNEGDWVLFRPHAGTYIMNGQITSVFGLRYLSSHKDVLGFIPAEDMPVSADASFEEETVNG